MRISLFFPLSCDMQFEESILGITIVIDYKSMALNVLQGKKRCISQVMLKDLLFRRE